VDVPAAEQVAAVLVMVGVVIEVSCAALLKAAEALDVQLPAFAVTVYEVPVVIPLINPPDPTVGPEGVNVYVLVLL
jgi:hypothetical protein